MSRAYYNENDPFAAAWLRILASEGCIADGDVDERSIVDVRPSDLAGYSQCHFFAGIGGWSLALRMSGWGDDQSVWTGSCPCQPFSQAGKHRGEEDERHLWPVFRDLIEKCSPSVVFGEQVASKAGRAWFSGVSADLERMAYAVAGADLCGAGVGAPHIRQRLWFVGLADAECWPSKRHRYEVDGTTESLQGATRKQRIWSDTWNGRSIERLADACGERLQGWGCPVGGQHSTHGPSSSCRSTGGSRSADEAYGGWEDADWVFCRDGKWRAVEPGTQPLADGIPAKVGRLRGYGNAIIPQVAAQFIGSVVDFMEELN